MFIVVPRITSEPVIYGVYMLCISTAIFLSYADIGFVGAGYKYCAECFARKDLQSEIEIQGFVSFVLAVFVSIFVVFYLAASFWPELLIKDINSSVESAIASKLLLIQAIFSFTIFRSDSYDIVGYFLFSKIVELAAVSLGIFLAKYRYNYNIGQLIRSFRFSKKIFDKTRRLAFGSFYVTIMWIIYYELDSIAISKLLGAEALAYFAIGLTISKFFRSLSSVIYSPFMARFNHFVGLADVQGLKNMYFTVIKRTMPMVVFPVLCILILMKPLILSWVGIDYVTSIRIGMFLIFSSLFIFISTPTALLIVALEKIRQLYLINTVMACVYWIGIAATVNYWQVESFAIFKLISLLIASLFYLVISMKFLEIDILQFIKKVILPIAGPVVFLMVSLILIEPYLPIEKGKANLLLVVFTGGVFSLLSFCLYYLMSKDFKGFINDNIGKIMGKRKLHPNSGGIL
jgi:O-antigen/teichoic acid export membrane protein